MNALPPQELIDLAAELGAPARRWAILAEGNCSVTDTSGTRAGEEMWVKASGARMETASKSDFVKLRRQLLLQVIDDESASPDDVSAVFDDVARGYEGRRPSVESLLHAVCLDAPGVRFAGHTHPVPVNAILCSRQPTLLTDGSLFPDQVVVLGISPMYIPYVDPGLDLARAVRRQLQERPDESPPRVVYLGNHGMFALGSTHSDVVNITAMAVKVAEVIIGANAAGGVEYLSGEEAMRIDQRPDEKHRRALLNQSPHQLGAVP